MGLVDIHIHADAYNTNRNGRPDRHGETPDKIAEAVINNGLDGYVVLAHQSPTAEFFKVEEEIAQLTQNTADQIWGILGMESVFHHGSQKFHLGFLYDRNYSANNLPAQFDKLSGLNGLEEYKKDYPGAVILYHPGLVLKKSQKYCRDTILDLCNSGLIDGVEILNGSVVYRGGHVNRELALAVLLKNTLAICGGSDAHREEYVGMCATGFGGINIATSESDETNTVTGLTRADFFDSIRNRTTNACALHPGMVRDVVRNGLVNLPVSLDDFVKCKR